jgi:cysteinyl-tRNA synthetase
MLRAHYRSPLNYSDAGLDDARQALRRLYTALGAASARAQTGSIDWSEPHAARFKAAMDDDLNTPIAMSVLFDLAGEVNRTHSSDAAGLLRALGGTLGLLQQPPEQYLQAGGDIAESHIQAQIAVRAAAKAAKNFAESDRIRDALAAQGIVLKDTPAGTTWVKA